MIKKIITNYANVKIPNTSPAARTTQKNIHTMRIKDEIKFLYKKKQKLNKDLYNESSELEPETLQFSNSSKTPAFLSPHPALILQRWIQY